MTSTPDDLPLVPSAGEAYRRLLEAMPVMLWTADARGMWAHVNKACGATGCVKLSVVG